MKSRPSPRNFRTLSLLALAAAWLALPVHAGGFAATVSPPRFELHARPGETLQEVVEISNTDSAPADYDLRSADWQLSASGGVTIFPPQLQPGSCRPWTRIERRHIRLPAEGQRRYRIQIRVPEDAQAGECRVALLLQGGEDRAVMANADAIRFPVQGRIAIIFYVTIGDARPDLGLLEMHMETVNNRQLPVAVMRNDGKAHGRPTGILQGKDALGREFEFTVSPSPILPGQTRHIPIWPDHDTGQEATDLVAPLHLTGTIEWDGGSQKIDTSVSPTHRIGLAESR
jgi:fimbrial chaperone protein